MERKEAKFMPKNKVFGQAVGGARIYSPSTLFTVKKAITMKGEMRWKILSQNRK